jgi:hypothetical protein
MRLSAALIAALLLTLAACAAPAPTNPENATTQPAPASSPATPPAPASPEPAPRSEPEPASSGSVAIDRSCKTDADCTVKNVGNCCGYYPACVNVNSPTDPKGVQAECAKKGMMSVCGFPDISSCSCKQGHCEAGAAQALQ